MTSQTSDVISIAITAQHKELVIIVTGYQCSRTHHLFASLIQLSTNVTDHMVYLNCIIFYDVNTGFRSLTLL